MDHQHILIIGGVAAGPKAAARARRLLPEAQITIVDQGEWISYGSCGIPLFLSGMVPDFKDLATTSSGDFRDVSYFKNVKEIEVLTHTKAEEIKRSKQQVLLRDLTTDETFELSYDQLVLATGARPVIPPLPGIDLKGIYPVHSPEDALQLREALKQGAAKIVVVGGGLIGLEITNALQKRNRKITLVELEEQVMPKQLDSEMAELVKKRLKERGVDVFTSACCLEFINEKGDSVSGVKTDKGIIPADIVILAVGVRPSVELAEKAGLMLGSTGAILVDKYLRTSDPLIFAGGDCVENINLVSEKPLYAPMASIATKQGRVIGDNLAGKNTVFPGVLGTVGLSVFDLNIGRTGLSEQQAKELGFDTASIIVSGYDLVHYHPLHSRGVIKIIAEAKSGKLLGAQVVGEGEVIKRLDVFATALQLGASVQELSNLDLTYAPEYATPQDLLIHAANALINKLNGPVGGIKLREIPKDALLVDVRSPEEVSAWPLEGFETVNIPLGEVNKEYQKLPQERMLVVFCELGTRSYEVACFLKGKGYREVYFLEGGLEANSWWTGENG